MKILFLDDDPIRQRRRLWERGDGEEIYQSWDAADCIAKLGAEWDLVSLDHDLNGIPFDDPAQENSGSAVVRWIVGNKPKVGKFVVHSYNHLESPKMVDILRGAGYDAECIPFNF